MIVPVACETDSCANKGRLINWIMGIAPTQIETFYADFDGTQADDVCPVCGQSGVALDPEPEVSDAL